MLKKKTITVLTMSVVLSTAIGYSTPHKRVYAELKDGAYLGQNLVSGENATLVLNQKSGSNDVSLVLEFSEDYDRSVTSFEVLIQLDHTKIKNVTMDWNKEFTTNHCRYTYDGKTGKLKLYVVETNDLLNDRKITIGNMSLVSDETTNFKSSLILEELKTVDLQHKSDVVTVDRKTHNIDFTVSQLPPSTDKPSTDKPSTDKPSTDEPSTDEPSTDEPSTDKPSTDNSTTDNPTTDNSSTDNSSTGNSSTGNSSTGNSSTEAPGTTPSIVLVQDIKLSKTEETLEVGKTVSLTATVLPSNASNKAVVWSSSSPEVATVSNGEVIAKSEGTTTIAVKTQDGSEKEATCIITVVKNESNQEEATLTEDESLSMEESIDDESQKDSLDSSKSESTSDSQSGEVKETKVAKVMIIIASVIGAILLVLSFVFVIVKLQKGKVLNTSQEKQKTDLEDES